MVNCPLGRAFWIEVRLKSPSIDWPVEDPTLARKTATGIFLTQSSFDEAVEFKSEEQEVFKNNESKELWNAGVSGLVRGNAPPL